MWTLSFQGFLEPQQSPWTRPHSEGCRIFPPAPAALAKSPGACWLQAPRKSGVVSKRARELRPSGNMPTNQSSPQWSPALAAEEHGRLCEVRRERTPGAEIRSVGRPPLLVTRASAMRQGGHRGSRLQTHCP